VSGSTEVSFVQTRAGNAGKLLVNGSVGSSARSLVSYQLNFVTDADGVLHILVTNQNSLTGEIAVAGTAFLGPVPASGAAPRLAVGGLSDQGYFQIAVNGTVGETYVLQRASSLNGENWLSVSTNAAPFTFTDTGSLGLDTGQQRG
jgi:hypothetical protein